MNKAEVDTYRNEIIDRLARLEEKHDSHMNITKEIRVDVKYQNGRVGKLEQKQSWVAGTLGAITFVFSGLIAWIKGEI
jgi:hypothetical protein|tara:strand:- start:412 stop:645 length:234 start_codon:yes stop_codon:yes gene_type:complete